MTRALLVFIQGSTEMRKVEPPRELVFVLDDMLYKSISQAKHVYNNLVSFINER